MAREDYYSLLGLDKQAPDREIKRAYYKLARDLHPDKAKTPEEARANAERLAVISQAYNTLKDPQKRAAYDSGAPAGPARKAAAPAGSSTPAPSGGSAEAGTPSGGGVAGMPPAARAAMNRPAGPGQQGASAGNIGGAKVSASDLASQRVLMAQKAFIKGMEYYKAGDFKTALPFFEAAVQNDPESEAHYHMKLAICLTKTKGSFSRAVQAAEKACSLDAYNTDFKLGLAEIYETVGITSKAAAVYEDVLRWEADNEKAKMRLQFLKSAEKSKNPGFLQKYFPSLFKK